MKKIILASASPRRSRLLENMGLQFEIRSPLVFEKLKEGVSPQLLAEKLAREKAQSVEDQVESGVIIAADTIVALGDQILGKPGDRVEAIDMLSRLSARKHHVITGVCLIDRETNRLLLESEVTEVHFRALDSQDIIAYVETGEPFDKAGAYGIQGKGAVLVERIEGCYYNVVGLPLTRLYLMLREVGIDILAPGK